MHNIIRGWILTVIGFFQTNLMILYLEAVNYKVVTALETLEGHPPTMSNALAQHIETTRDKNGHQMSVLKVRVCCELHQLQSTGGRAQWRWPLCTCARISASAAVISVPTYPHIMCNQWRLDVFFFVRITCKMVTPPHPKMFLIPVKNYIHLMILFRCTRNKTVKK